MGKIKRTKEYCENMSRIKMGVVFTEEHKQNISRKRLERKQKLGYLNSPETRKKISKALVGKKHLEETKIKMGKAHKGREILWADKISNALKGRKIPKLVRDKISRALSGEKHPRWQGGISKEPYPFNFNKELKEIIRRRDKYVCQLCNKTQQDIAHSVHHIDYDKKNCDPKNLITLCKSCHMKTNYNKKHWEQFFRGVILRKSQRRK